MPIDFYYSPSSAGCRAVIMTARAIKLDMNFKKLDYENQEEKHEPYTKLNPQRNCPTINDNGFVLTESRAIMCYLVDKYGKDDVLYPKDPAWRALVNQRLYFDLATLHQRYGDLYYPMIFRDAPCVESRKKRLEEAYRFLDNYLMETNPWVTGKNMTIADFSIGTTVSTAVATGFNLKPYVYVTKWFELAREKIDGFKEINSPAVKVYRARARIFIEQCY